METGYPGRRLEFGSGGVLRYLGTSEEGMQ